MDVCLKTFLIKRVLHLILLYFSLSIETRAEQEEFCQSEYFRPRCLKNEVILMTDAIYGRMRIGRCITAKEIAAFGSQFASDPRYLGCSMNVIDLLDKKCSAKPQCEIRIVDISDDNIQPCSPGLNVYLEASFTCINVADEKRSCTVIASKTPSHILASSEASSLCGTKSQPWILEAPVGQKIKLKLLDFSATKSAKNEEQMASGCRSYGVIVDKAGKMNTSICRRTDAESRENELYLSRANALYLYLDPIAAAQFILKLEAIGCSDIIPPEDSWLKREDNKIAIGCYSSRQTWNLNCNGEKWVGVLGNCSQDDPSSDSGMNSNPKPGISTDEQVLAIVAICGCTLAICLAITCVGVVCLRRFHDQANKKHEYKSFNCSVNSARSQWREQRLISDVASNLTNNRMDGCDTQHPPTYSVYVGTGDFSDNDRSATGVNQIL